MTRTLCFSLLAASEAERRTAHTLYTLHVYQYRREQPLSGQRQGVYLLLPAAGATRGHSPPAALCSLTSGFVILSTCLMNCALHLRQGRCDAMRCLRVLCTSTVLHSCNAI